MNKLTLLLLMCLAHTITSQPDTCTDQEFRILDGISPQTDLTDNPAQSCGSILVCMNACVDCVTFVCDNNQCWSTLDDLVARSPLVFRLGYVTVHLKDAPHVFYSCANVGGSHTDRPLVTLNGGHHVVCDVSHGGWIVFLRRTSADIDFDEDWANYKLGFGNLKGNFWYGLEKIYKLCNAASPCEMRVDMKYNGQRYYAQYDTFTLSGEDGFYTLSVSGYTGDTEDSLIKRHHNMRFTTKDVDNDINKKEVMFF